MHLKFANHKCSHYTHINYAMMDVSNSLIVVIISQHIHVSNHHAAQLKYILFYLSITPWWSWKKCLELRIGGEGGVWYTDMEHIGASKNEKFFKWIQTLFLGRVTSDISSRNIWWNLKKRGRWGGQNSCDTFDFINTKLALLVREDRSYWLNGTLILGIWNRSHYPWLLPS